MTWAGIWTFEQLESGEVDEVVEVNGYGLEFVAEIVLLNFHVLALHTVVVHDLLHVYVFGQQHCHVTREPTSMTHQLHRSSTQ